MDHFGNVSFIHTARLKNQEGKFYTAWEVRDGICKHEWLMKNKYDVGESTKFIYK